MDFEYFRAEYVSYRNGALDINTAKADFNFDKKIDLADFEIFRVGYISRR